MIMSDVKYVDPSEVLKSIADDTGNFIPIGDQKDVGEFNLFLMARIEEGLQQQEINKKKTSSKILEEGDPKSSVIGSSPERMSQSTNGDLMRKVSMNIIQEESIVSQLFFGKYKQIITFNNEENQMIEKFEEELFNIIFLDISYRDLYSSWDAFNFSTIDDYRTEKGSQVQAKKTNWITKPPSTLLFQLQRVVFDKEAGAKKLNDVFNFEKEIYIDRFLEENKSLYMDIREKVQKLKQRAQIFEESIQKIKNFNNSDMNLVNIFQQFENFIQYQNKPNKPDDYIKDPTFFGAKGDVNSAFSVLSSYKKALTERLEDLEMQLEKIKKEIENSYNPFKTHKYRLLSILIHDGHAESGHYYTFINDFEYQKWRRYNDMQITEETEDKVFKEALGGYVNMSAYCLIYVKEDTFFPPFEQPIRKYSITESRENDIYIEFLKEANLLSEMETENIKYAQQVEEYQCSNQVKAIIEEYQRRFEYVNELTRKFKDRISSEAKFKPDCFINFCCYLKNLPNYDKLPQYDEFVKWHLLNSTLIDMSPEKLGLDSIALFPISFQDKMKQSLSSLSKFKTTNVELPKLFADEYYRFLKEYSEKVQAATLVNYILDCSIKEEFEKALVASAFFKEIHTAFDIYIKVDRDFTPMVLLRLCSYIISETLLGKSEKVLEILKLIHVFASNLTNDSLLYIQIKVYLTDVETIGAESLNNEALELIKKLNIEFKENSGSQIKLEPYHNLINELKAKLFEAKDKYDPLIVNPFLKEDVLALELMENFNKFRNLFSDWCKFFNQLKTSKMPYLSEQRSQFNIV